MKKNILLLLIVFALSISLISCNSNKIGKTATPVPSESNVTETPEPHPEIEFTMNSGTVVYAWKGGAGTISHDLNSDGIEDNIEFNFTGYSSTMDISEKDIETARSQLMSIETNSCTITVNGTSINLDGENMQGLIIISDIDSSDKFYEILIPEDGPSYDYSTTVIRYNGTDLQLIGKPGGIPQNTLAADGSGILKTTERGNILHTWFYKARYEVENGTLSELKENGYVNMDYQVTVLSDLPLQASPTDETPAYTLKTSDVAKLTWTDDKKWICVENEDKLEGWFEVESFSYIKILDKYAGEVFSNLSYAD